MNEENVPPLREYQGIYFRQRGLSGPAVVVFHAPVGEVLEWAEVDELGPSTTGPQREESDAKVRAIAKFLENDARNTIPTAAVVAFSAGMAKFEPSDNQELGVLKIASPTGAATIVDGRHRLAGLKQYDSFTKIAVVGLLDTDKAERAFQFLVINNKSTKVPTKHTKALLARLVDTDLVARLQTAKMAFSAQGVTDVDLVNTDRESPFFHMVDWPTTPEDGRIVPSTAIELSLDYLEGLKVPEFDDRDVRRAVFLCIWSRVKADWAECWKPKNRLISKVGIVCLTRFIADSITSWSDSDEIEIDLMNLRQIDEYTGKILKNMDLAFWNAAWAEKSPGSFDTNQGRERVYGALRQLYRNGRRGDLWHEDIDIIERTREG